MDLTQNTPSGSGKVCININPITDTYSLVCNYCETGVRFSNFDEFLGHARDVHGPCLGVSAMKIVPGNANNRPQPEVATTSSIQSVAFVSANTNMSSEQVIPTSSCSQSKSRLSNVSSSAFSTIVHPSFSPMTSMSTSTVETLVPIPTPTAASSTATTSNSTSTHHHKQHSSYDLRTLKRPCLLELIQLLNKCLCIWHKTTRLNATSKDRFRAYQLLLIKLREHQPEATFRNVRSIVRQLISRFFSNKKQCIVASDVVVAIIDAKPLPRVKEEQESEQCENPLLEQDPTKSRTVLDQLMFLNQTDTKDIDELEIDKLCSFCEMGFYTTEALWTHMINAHLPDKNKDRDVSPTAKSSRSATPHQHCRRDMFAAASTSSAAARAAAAHPSPSPTPTSTTVTTRKRSQSRDWRSANETDYYTDFTDSEWDRRSSVRRSRRHKKCGWRYDKFGGAPHAKRTRHKHLASESSSNVDTDSSNADSKPSTFYLSDYSDKFLEDFIDLYRKHECLWQENAPSYRQRKLKTAAYETLLAKYRQAASTSNNTMSTISVSKVKRLIRRMRGYYERLNRPHANPYRSHIWQRMAFIETGRRVQRRNAGGGGGDGPLWCNKCARRFKRDKYYLSHKLKEHPPTECPPCRENFGNADELHQHLLLHHNKATECPLCRDSHLDWKSPLHLAEHFYDHKCPMCSKVFHDTINFQRHKSQCRARDRFKCHRCPAVFSTSMDFRRHALFQHQDEHPFKCDQCEVAFKYLAPLTKHRRVHNNLQQQRG